MVISHMTTDSRPQCANCGSDDLPLHILQPTERLDLLMHIHIFISQQRESWTCRFIFIYSSANREREAGPANAYSSTNKSCSMVT